MKVKIGPYLNWIGPYQIAEKILFWLDKYEDRRVHNFGTWLAEKKDGKDTLLAKACNWIYSKKKRKVSIRIDDYDAWSANHTLALIILPLLKRLKVTKHGSGYIDDADVPEYLRSTAAPAKENEWDTDTNFHKRYEWFLDEIIWAMGEVIKDDELDQFYDYSEVPEQERHTLGGVSKAKFDAEGFDTYQKRKQHALTLFGKYFETLWD